MDGEGADSITTRRNVLKATAGLGAVGVTGCISNGEEETETRNYYSIIKNEDVTAYDIRTDEVVAWGSTFGDIIGDFLSRIGDESVPATVRIGGGEVQSRLRRLGADSRPQRVALGRSRTGHD